MIMSSELTFSTPASHIAKFIVAAIVGGIIAVALLLLIVGRAQLIFIIVPVVMICLMSRHKVSVSDDSLRIAFGFSKKDYSFKDTLFRYEDPKAPINPLRRLGPRNHLLYTQRQWQKQAKIALNLATPDFEALIAALKERGAQVEVA